jgi:hypothetical protein
MANDVFDEEFKNRLMAFQRDHGLTLDGTLGPQSWGKLAEAAASKPEQSAEQPDQAATKAENQQEDQTGQPVVTAEQPAITPEEFPLLSRFVTLCVTEEGTKQFIRDELDVDLDELNAFIEEVLA